MSLDGCSSSTVFTQQASICTSISEASKADNTVNIYPNPNNGVFNIKLNEKTQVILVNNFGQIIINNFMEDGEQMIDIQKEVIGIYTLKLISNGQQSTNKLIKN